MDWGLTPSTPPAQKEAPPSTPRSDSQRLFDLEKSMAQVLGTLGVLNENMDALVEHARGHPMKRRPRRNHASLPQSTSSTQGRGATHSSIDESPLTRSRSTTGRFRVDIKDAELYRASAGEPSPLFVCGCASFCWWRKP